MPGVLPPNEDYGSYMLADILSRLTALEAQQVSYVTDTTGNPVVVFGLSPGSNPPQYGLQLLSPAGNEVGFYGEDSSGTVALKFRDSTGAVILEISSSGITFYNDSGAVEGSYTASGLTFGGVTLSSAGLGAGGVTVNSSGLEAGGVTVNSSGLTAGPVSLTASGLAAGGGVEVNANGLEVYNGTTLEVQAGKINASPAIYGIGVRPYNGPQLQQVGGMLNVQPSSALNVTNTSPVAFGGSSSVTCEIGPSGQALIGAQCEISTGTGGQNGTVVVQADGGSWYAFLDVSTSAPNGVTVNTGTTYPWGGLSAGTHTFTIGYYTGANGTSSVSFRSPVLTVQPL